MARRVKDISHLRPVDDTTAGPTDVCGGRCAESARAHSSARAARTKGHQAAHRPLRRADRAQHVLAGRQQRGGAVHANERQADGREGVQQAEARQLVVQPATQRAGSDDAQRWGSVPLLRQAQRQRHALVQVRRVLRVGCRLVEDGKSKASETSASARLVCGCVHELRAALRIESQHLWPRAVQVARHDVRHELLAHLARGGDKQNVCRSERTVSAQRRAVA